MDEAELKRQRWLKVIVIALGLMILVLLGGVIYTVLMRGNKAASDRAAGIVSTKHVGPGFGDIKIALPAGARFEDMKTDDGRIYVQVSLASGGTQILILSPQSGRQFGSFEFAPK